LVVLAVVEKKFVVVALVVVALRAWKVRRPFWLMVNAVYVDVAKVEGEDVAR
jgi:hypothetical protein